MSLRELREDNGYKRLKDFAKGLNENVTTVCMWEKGKSKPSLEKTKQIANLLKVSIETVVNCFTK